MSTKRTLEEALKEVLRDDNKISKYEAKVLKEIIMADGKVSPDEKRVLETALQNNSFDDHALQMLSEMLFRQEAKLRY